LLAPPVLTLLFITHSSRRVGHEHHLGFVRPAVQHNSRDSRNNFICPTLFLIRHFTWQSQIISTVGFVANSLGVLQPAGTAWHHPYLVGTGVLMYVSLILDKTPHEPQTLLELPILARISRNVLNLAKPVK
jgi:hypothetical protein